MGRKVSVCVPGNDMGNGKVVFRRAEGGDRGKVGT